MPQKRNPDAAELVRAKAARIIAASQSLLTLMKGLPLAYAKDMQEDKAITFEAADNLALSLAAMTGMVADLTPNIAAMRNAASAGYATATDLADWLVKTLKIPFREAHHIVGRIVLHAEAKGVDLAQLPLAEMVSVDSRITQGVYDVLSVEKSVESRTSFGGTAPQNVKSQVAYWREKLK
jgi:argininosuccinate lyase